MSRHLEKAISKLMEEMIGLSAHVEENVKNAVLSIKNRDVELAEKVIEDDELIDKKEIDIEEECLKIFALHQPVAVDLRYLVAVLKINNDLERIGDLAQNISRNSINLQKSLYKTNPVDFEEIFKNVQQMLKKSLKALVNLDADAAKEVLEADNEVDRINYEIYQDIIKEIKNSPDKVAYLIQFIHISRHLERIADHTTNIAEDIIYLITGDIIRHGGGF